VCKIKKYTYNMRVFVWEREKFKKDGKCEYKLKEDIRI
jgi:hypothetical protein